MVIQTGTKLAVHGYIYNTDERHVPLILLVFEIGDFVS